MGTVGDDCAIEPVMLQLSPWTSLHQVWGGGRRHQAPPSPNFGFVPMCPNPPPQAHHLFELLKLQHIFVTRYGQLVGAVTRAEVGHGGDTGGGTPGGGGTQGDSARPTASFPLQLRRAIEELANPK